jgi:hypothetical protein
MLDGTPCQPWNIGEWSLDKRHFNECGRPPHAATAVLTWSL